MNEVKALERAALAAHRNGQGWSQYWEAHADEVRKAEPWSRQRFKRLVDRLLHLLTTGEPGGQEPPGDDPEPWLTDDSPAPSDCTTQARYLGNVG